MTIKSIDYLNYTLDNLRLLAIKLDKDIASTIQYIYFNYGLIREDEDLNNVINDLVYGILSDDYITNKRDVEAGDNGEW